MITTKMNLRNHITDSQIARVAEAYHRALPHTEEEWQKLKNTDKDNPWQRLDALMEEYLDAHNLFLASHEGSQTCYLSSPEQLRGTIAVSVNVSEAMRQYGPTSVLDAVFGPRILDKLTNREASWKRSSE